MDRLRWGHAMRVLVIGGTNFIGPPAVEQLVTAGRDVTLFHRGEREHPVAGVAHLHGDRARLDDFRGDVERIAPDVVLDMAPMSGADAEAVMRVCRGAVKRVVAISSVDVYRAYGRLHASEPGPPEPLPLTEDSPLRERLHPYRGERGGRLDGYDKIPAERAVMSDPELPGTVLRLPAVHGERDYQHRLFMEVARFDAKRPFILVQEDAAEWRWPRAYVGNVAHAIALAVTDARAAGRIYNAPVDPALTQIEWLRTCARIAGWDGEIVTAPAEALPEGLRSTNNLAQSMVIDDSRIRGELRHADTFTAEEGMQRAMEWERAHPPRKVDPRWVDFEAEDRAYEQLRRGLGR